MNKELLNICYKKHNKEINLSWEELAKKYNFSSGECLRSWFKRIRRENGEIGYKNKTRILHISGNHYPFNLPKEVFKDYVGRLLLLTKKLSLL